MADRTTKVTLTAVVSGYLNGMDQAARKTREFADGSTQKLAAQRDAMTKVGTAALAVGAAAAAGVALAVKSFADFDAKMSQVKTLSHATAAEMDGLTKSALTMGQAIGFSATETADAEIELVKAGLSVSNIMGGALKGSLDLAAAGQIDVGKATEIATIALTQFNLKGKDVPHVADLLAAGADKALGGVSDLGEALKSGGLVAAQFGVSLDETVGTLSAFANAGLLGETAGTDLRQMLLKLANPSVESAKTLKELGISIYDASGKFVGMAGLAGQLADKMGKLEPAQRNAALAVIFGSRAIAGANVLYKEGAKGISDWTNNVNDAGFATQQANGKMDNLNGDLKKLGAAFQTDLIETGSQANVALRGITQTTTNLVKAFADLPGPAQAAILIAGAVVGVVGLVGGTALIAVPKIAAFKDGLVALGTSFRTVSLASGAVGLAITAIVTALAFVANSQAEAKARTDEFTSSLDTNTGAITKNTRAIAAKQLHDNGAIEAANKLGVSLSLITDASLGNADAIAALNKKQDEFTQKKDAAIAAGKGDTNEVMNQTGAWVKLATGVGLTSASLKDAKRDSENTRKALAEGTDSTQTAAEAYQSAADKAKALDDAISNLTDQINKANGVGQDAVSANASYQKALESSQKAVDAYLKAHGKSTAALDENTAAGSTNAAMLSDLAKSAQDAAKKQLDLDGNTTDYQKRLEAGHQAVVDRAIALGATADQAQKLADKVAAIPTEKEIQLLVNTADAEVKIAALNAALNAAAATRNAVINVVTNGDGTSSRSHIARAGGGEIHGPGTSTSDSVPLWGSDGEFMINAASYAKNKALVQAINNDSLAGWQPANYAPPAPSIGMPSAPSGPSKNVKVTQNIYPTPGMSEATVGSISASKLNYALRGL